MLTEKTITVEVYTTAGRAKKLAQYGAEYWLDLGTAWLTNGDAGEITDAVNEVVPLFQNNLPYNREYSWVFKTKPKDGNRVAFYLYVLPEIQTPAAIEKLESDLLAIMTAATKANRGKVSRATIMTDGKLYYQIVCDFN